MYMLYAIQKFIILTGLGAVKRFYPDFGQIGEVSSFYNLLFDNGSGSCFQYAEQYR
jgi:hypothetical protein